MTATVVELIAKALYFILPAYCANAIPVIFGGEPPMDFGRNFIDGKPLFGSHKTFRGFFSGLFIGTLIGIVQSNLLIFQPPQVLQGFVLSLGGLTGDLIHSFVKRRLGLPPGASFPVADQLDFVIGALLFSLFVSPPSLTVALIILTVTPPMHLLTNYLAYRLGMKKEPF
jgi:CDP-2,3-bis-(O-geranylgeranyl)-sn-glycerol synthase